MCVCVWRTHTETNDIYNYIYIYIDIGVCICNILFCLVKAHFHPDFWRREALKRPGTRRATALPAEAVATIRASLQARHGATRP